VYEQSNLVILIITGGLNMQLDFILNPDYVNVVFAYIDPGTGSLIIQITIGLVVAIGVSTKMYWSKIKKYFSKNKMEEKNDG